jgi:threonine/homoserine efflux transporter RhtA
MATLACCLPWGIGAALGALGLSVFLARFQLEFIVLSVVLLGVGLIQILRRGRSCRRRSPVEIAIWGIGLAVVLAVVLFPEWVASLLAGHHP